MDVIVRYKSGRTITVESEAVDCLLLMPRPRINYAGIIRAVGWAVVYPHSSTMTGYTIAEFSARHVAISFAQMLNRRFDIAAIAEAVIRGDGAIYNVEIRKIIQLTKHECNLPSADSNQLYKVQE